MARKLWGLLFALVLVSSTAFAGDGWYLSGNIGVSIPSDADTSIPPVGTADTEFDTGIDLAVAVGYGFADIPVRTELEVFYLQSNIGTVTLGGTPGSGDDVSNIGLLLNGYYDFRNDTSFFPFVSAGVGFSRVDFSDLTVSGTRIDDEDTVFAYQVGAGVGWDTTDHVTLELKYRYLGTSDPEFGAAESEFDSNEITVGARYFF